MTDMNKQTEALKLAEDALKRVRTQDMELVQMSMIALAALREAQASEAKEQPAPATELREQEPLTDEQHSLAYWQHEINKARDEAYLQGFAAGKKEVKCSAG